MHINSLLINIIESLWLIVRHANKKDNQTGRKKSGYFMPYWLMKTSIWSKENVELQPAKPEKIHGKTCVCK